MEGVPHTIREGRNTMEGVPQPIQEGRNTMEGVPHTIYGDEKSCKGYHAPYGGIKYHGRNTKSITYHMEVPNTIWGEDGRVPHMVHMRHMVHMVQ